MKTLSISLLSFSLIIVLSSNANAQVMCEDFCGSAYDGECDDGGPGSLYDICPYGSDCGDCGPRYVATPMPPHPEPLACENYCPHAFDGECDDGGPGALYDICEYGSDCGDCGPRHMLVPMPPHPMPPHPEPVMCEDFCAFAFDGECDDGGPGALYDVCEYGSDCGDCGPRHMLVPMPPHPVPHPEPMICENFCPYSFDGECDDGGPGALNALCGYGTDCGDCGPRIP